MRARTEAITVRDRWPWFQILIDRDVPESAVTFRAFGVSSQAWELTEWFNRQQAWGFDGAPPEVFDVDQEVRRAALTTWLEATHADPAARAAWASERILRSEGSIGWVLMDRWADPHLEIEAWADWRAGKYTGETARVQAGSDALREICDALGIGTRRAENIAHAILKRMQSEEPDAEDLAEARVFPRPTR